MYPSCFKTAESALQPEISERDDETSHHQIFQQKRPVHWTNLTISFPYPPASALFWLRLASFDLLFEPRHTQPHGQIFCKHPTCLQQRSISLSCQSLFVSLRMAVDELVVSGSSDGEQTMKLFSPFHFLSFISNYGWISTF